jgi:hypothetical protein
MIILFLLLESLSFAGTSRVPAVLEASCDLNVTTTNKSLIEINLEQCKQVRKCMNSAGDEEMPALKKLEALACKGDLIPVSTSVPNLESNKAEFNKNSLKEKELNKDQQIFVPANTAIEK